MRPPSSLERAFLTVGGLTFLTLQAFWALIRPPYEGRAWIREMEQIGWRSLGVAAITAVFTGMVLALQTAYSLPSIGGPGGAACYNAEMSRRVRLAVGGLQRSF